MDNSEPLIEQRPPASDSLPPNDDVQSVQARSNRELWLELLAVLAIGVVPHFWDAIVSLLDPRPTLPYWLNAIDLCVSSALVACLVLYLIHRTGRPWSDFGLLRFKLIDLASGFLLFVAGLIVWMAASSCLVPFKVRYSDSPFPLPKAWQDFLLMGPKFIADALAEELVIRAYLISRLVHITRSRVTAIFISSIFFASYHLYQGIPGVTYTLLLGLTFGTVFLLIRRLWPCVLGHALISVFSELAGAFQG